MFCEYKSLRLVYGNGTESIISNSNIYSAIANVRWECNFVFLGQSMNIIKIRRLVNLDVAYYKNMTCCEDRHRLGKTVYETRSILS